MIQKKGISLIVLVITIIVMIIIAATIIISISNSGIIGKANEAKALSDIANIKQEAEIVKIELLASRKVADKTVLAVNNVTLLVALENHFKDSHQESNRVVVYDDKYDIYVKNELDITVVEHDKNYLKDGEISMFDTGTETGSVGYADINIKIAVGVESYSDFLMKIIEGKTQQEKEDLLSDALAEYDPEYYGVHEDPLQFFIEDCGFTTIEQMLQEWGYNSFDTFLIDMTVININEYYDMYKVNVTLPGNTTTEVNTYQTDHINYKAYENGTYVFTGVSSKNKTASVTVKVANIVPAVASTVTVPTPGEPTQTQQIPIPYGFAASPYEDENTNEEGFVIYELASGETSIPTSETQAVSKRTRNQYVWVPVPDFSQFTRRNTAYTFSGSVTNTIGPTGRWEVKLDENNMPVPYSELTDTEKTYITEKTVIEAVAMYNSVKKYKGFYIARYEMGIDEPISEFTLKTGEANVQSKQNKYVYNWMRQNSTTAYLNELGGAKQIGRSLYTSQKYGVVSTLIYGVQWDTAVNWLISSGTIVNPINISTDSRMYGNYAVSTINSGVTTYNEGAKYATYSNALGTYDNLQSDSSKVNRNKMVTNYRGFGNDKNKKYI